MSDVFERRAELNPWRERLWDLIEATPHLDWLLLTKRPQNIEKMARWGKKWPDNVWLGTTVENQKYAKLRLPHLLKHDVSVRFLSCEPLLGNIDLTQWMKRSIRKKQFGIDWIIAGGESGPGARPMLPEWARLLRDQCIAKNVAFHFKQWGHWVPEEIVTDEQRKSVLDIDGVRLVGMGKKGAGRSLDGDTWDGLPKVS